MIPVSKPFLPPLNEYEAILKGIWNRQWLTNMGPLASELELNLKKKLDVKHLLFVTNGTIALQLAIKSLNLSGDIITTPFSFVATSSSIVWEGCNPIFVDIEKDSLNIDPHKIEAAITEKTSAILATHVYGNPCDVEAISIVAKKYNLKVIYDGAHAFGVKFNGTSIFNFGDVSTCSLHATKLYHSGEGGLVITKKPELLKKIASMRNFGFESTISFSCLGINGKNSEFHAAMGLINLNYFDEIFVKRRLLTERYFEKLKNSNLKYPKWNSKSERNYAYFPVIFQNENIMLQCLEALNKKEIFARRYFYPSLSNSLPYIESSKMENSDNISCRILCLPLYFDLSIVEVDLICRIILRVLNN